MAYSGCKFQSSAVQKKPFLASKLGYLVSFPSLYHVYCKYINIFIYIYIHIWKLFVLYFCGFNPPKKGPFQSKQGSFAKYIYTLYTNWLRRILCLGHSNKPPQVSSCLFCHLETETTKWSTTVDRFIHDFYNGDIVQLIPINKFVQHGSSSPKI